MKRRTAFEIMRRNRQKLDDTARRCAADLHWEARSAQAQAERLAQYTDTLDWLRDTREQTRPKSSGAALAQEFEPTLLQVLLHIAARLPGRCWRAVFPTRSRTA